MKWIQRLLMGGTLDTVMRKSDLDFFSSSNAGQRVPVSAAIFDPTTLRVVVFFHRKVNYLGAHGAAKNRVHVRIGVSFPCNSVQAYLPVGFSSCSTHHLRYELVFLPREGNVPEVQTRNWTVIRDSYLRVWIALNSFSPNAATVL